MSASIHRPSIYSTTSYASPARSSCERLIPVKQELRYSSPRAGTGSQIGQGRHSHPARSPGKGKRTAITGIPVEQKKSYGIGGAGNIRKPSDVIYPPRTNDDGTRRRQSVWSSITTASPSSSTDGKRTTLLNLFSRKGSAGESSAAATEVVNAEERVGFGAVDLGGRKD